MAAEQDEPASPAQHDASSLEIKPETVTPEKDASEAVTGLRLLLVMVSVSLVCFLMLLDMSIIVTAVPRITTEFHSLGDTGWYGSAYNLASAALQPLGGKLYTYFKAKWTFLAFLFVFEIGSLLCGLANSSKMLIVSRAVAGMGGSGLMNGAMTIIAMSAPLEKRPSLMGMLMGIGQLGIVAGPLVGGSLTEYTTWRWCFYINLPIGAVAAALLFITQIPDRRQPLDGSLFNTIKNKFDLAGFVLFAPAAIMILLAVQWGGSEYAWNSATVIGLLCGGVATALLFIFWERHMGEDAMIPLSIVSKRQIWTGILCMVFLFWTVLVAAFYMPIYFQSIKNASPFTSGVDMLPTILTQLAAAVSGGFIVQKVGYYLPFAVLSGLVLAISNGLVSAWGVNTTTAVWAGEQILVGFGRGIGMQLPIIAVQSNAKPSQIPVATATLVFGQTFGGAIALAIANAVFNNKLKSEMLKHVPAPIVAGVINAGARGVRAATPSQYLPAVLEAYAKAVNSAFYIAVAGGCFLFVASFGIGWKDIRKKAEPQDQA